MFYIIGGCFFKVNNSDFSFPFISAAASGLAEWFRGHHGRQSSAGGEAVGGSGSLGSTTGDWATKEINLGQLTSDLLHRSLLQNAFFTKPWCWDSSWRLGIIHPPSAVFSYSKRLGYYVLGLDKLVFSYAFGHSSAFHTLSLLAGALTPCQCRRDQGDLLGRQQGQKGPDTQPSKIHTPRMGKNKKKWSNTGIIMHYRALSYRS